MLSDHPPKCTTFEEKSKLSILPDFLRFSVLSPQSEGRREVNAQADRNFLEEV